MTVRAGGWVLGTRLTSQSLKWKDLEKSGRRRDKIHSTGAKLLLPLLLQGRERDTSKGTGGYGGQGWCQGVT